MRMVFIVSLSLATSIARAALSLDDVYWAAITKSETVPIEESRLRQAEAEIERSRAGFLPQLSLGASYTRQDSAQNRDLSTGRLTLSQSLFSGGSTRATHSTAQAERNAQAQAVEAARAELFTLVARAYFNVIAAEREVDNLRAILSQSEERVGLLKRRGSIGRARSTEVLAAESQLAVLQAQLGQARGDVGVARNQLAFLTGLGSDSPLATELKLPPPPGALNEQLKRIDERPSIKALRETERAASAAIAGARAGHFPSLDLTANYYPWRRGGSASSQEIDWDVGLGLTVPLYRGGATHAGVKAASEAETQARLRLAQARRQAEEELRSAHTTLVTALSQIEALERAASATERNYRVQQREYGFGLVTNLDVLQALNSYLESKRSLDRARVTALSAAAEVRAATNDLPQKAIQKANP